MKDDFYKYGGFWWKSNGYEDRHGFSHIIGPYCNDCYGDIGFPDEASQDEHWAVKWVGNVNCLTCDKRHKFNSPLYFFKEKVAQLLNSSYRSTLNKIALDEPVSQVKVRDEDDKFFLAAKIGQKDGKRVGVVYFGEKNKDQKKKDYSQVFIDLEDEQVRFDKSNKNPLDISAKFTVDFPKSSTISRSKKLKSEI